MSRRPKRELRWNEPPPRALEWVRLCIASGQAFADRNEREDFARHTESYGLDWARRWLREDRRVRRMHALIVSLTLQLAEEEQQALMSWWGETPTTDPELPDPSGKLTMRGEPSAPDDPEQRSKAE